MEVIASGSPSFDHVKNVRMQVFVKEQGVPADMEIDDDEDRCVHMGWRDKDGVLAGVCRLNPHPPFVKLQRVAVLESHRKLGIGSIVNNFAILEAKRRFPNLLLVAHAQTSALPFYLKLGFIVVSKEFVEILDDTSIPHHTIIYPDLELINDYDVLCGKSSTAHESYEEGEYNDPVVVDRVVEILNLVKENKFMLMCSVMKHICERFIGGSITGKFTQWAASVLDRQLNIEGRVYPLVISNESEELLLGIGWEKLNTGHYSEVDERWRRFYFAVSLVKCVRLMIEKNYKEAIKALDMGLLMGTHLLSDREITSLVAQISQHISMDLAVEDSVEYPSTSTPVPLPNSVHIETSDEAISDETFLEKYLLPSKPVLFKGLYKKWGCKAMTTWTIRSLHQKLAHRTFPVEIGSKYTEDDWSQKLMTGNEFFTEMHKSPVPMYLAQHRLLDQVVDLKDDIAIPPFCLVTGSSEQDVDVNVWIGPQGTVSPLHTDPKDNLFVQINGTKFVRLISPDDNEKVYANQDGILTNTSQVDVENPDLEQFPSFRDATVYDVQVDAGDVLFIPKGWWHYVRSISPSISLSFWFINDLAE